MGHGKVVSALVLEDLTPDLHLEGLETQQLVLVVFFFFDRKWFDFLKAARTTTVVFDERLYIEVDSLLVEAKKHGAVTSLVTELMTFGDKCAAMIAAGP